MDPKLLEDYYDAEREKDERFRKFAQLSFIIAIVSFSICAVACSIVMIIIASR